MDSRDIAKCDVFQWQEMKSILWQHRRLPVNIGRPLLRPMIFAVFTRGPAIGISMSPLAHIDHVVPVPFLHCSQDLSDIGCIYCVLICQR